MPKRNAAITNEVLIREAGALSDDVLLLPEQVKILTGLGVDKLRERARAHPEWPPQRDPRESKNDGVWYSLGECRRYRSTVKQDAELAAAAASTLKEWKRDKLWPIAFIGQFGHPVDFWETLNDRVPFGDDDQTRWMTHKEFNDARRVAIAHEADATLAAQRADDLSQRKLNGHGKHKQYP